LDLLADSGLKAAVTRGGLKLRLDPIQ